MSNLSILKLVFKLPVILLFAFIIALFANEAFPIWWQQLFYSLSLSIKEVFVFILPLIIFSLLFSSVVKLSGKAIWLVIMLIPLLSISNFITTMIANFTGQISLTWIDMATSIAHVESKLKPLWSITLAKWCPNEIALISGFSAGVAFLLKDAFFPKGITTSNAIANCFNTLATGVLRYGFIPTIPIFMFGFLLKLQYDGVLETLVKNYAYVFIAVITIQVTYILFLYIVANLANRKQIVASIKNMLPAGITGFSTMSSAASLPLSLSGVEKNINSEESTKIIVPITVNIHLVGDCISIPIFALAIMESFGYASPDIITYMSFAVYFVIAKFAVAAVPGGGVLVMVPVLQQQLGFTSEMSALITALYVMSDSITTSMNVMGNGAFAIIVNKLFIRVKSLLKSP